MSDVTELAGEVAGGAVRALTQTTASSETTRRPKARVPGMETEPRQTRRPVVNLSEMPRILIVDDDADLCFAIEHRLNQYDVETQVGYFGQQGFWNAMTFRPDVIVTDLAMPNGDGGFLLDLIRSNATLSDTPVIVVSGMRDPKVRSQALARGANAFLQKPVTSEQLVEQLSRFVTLQPKTKRKFAKLYSNHCDDQTEGL
ncbi:response regulator [Roseiconus lacunae]|uniref:response regulator n=1 Tax=Roseiconus lacunae TaxID=2605694 RepID=UPI001E458127|nr:response regulator [Roseiconus lacunae]MCD0463639.1 response regulator [Roseiconus lacunae]